MSVYYFLSDVHLGAQDIGPETEEIFCSFLETIPQAGDTVFITGDLFDFFFNYKHVIPKGHYRALAALYHLHNRNIRLEYIAGNHDFWAGAFFEKELHAEFHSEPVTRIIDGKKFYICHGDGLKKNDVGYRILKKIFRNRMNIFLYKWLHPDIGVPFAKLCSHSSRKYTSKRDYGDDMEYIEHARRKFAAGTDYVLFSHTHRPGIHSEEGRTYLNTGDWIENYTFARFKDRELELLQYNPVNTEIFPFEKKLLEK